MRKIVFLFFVHAFIFPFVLFGQQGNINDASRYEGVLSRDDIRGARTLHPVAQRALAQHEKPGAFKNVTYSVAPNVRILTSEEKTQIRLKHDGVLDRSQLTTFEPDPSMIYLDKEGEFAFQALSVDESEMLVLKPKLSSIFTELNLPDQQVALTLANTVASDPEIETQSVLSSENYLIDFVFKDYKIVVDSSGKSGAFIVLSGNISITNPVIEARYSKNNGYRISFNAGQRMNLKVDMNIKLKQEQKVLLWGCDAPVPDLGKCSVGLFAVVSMEGKVTLTTEIVQSFDLQLGVKGNTFWYVPTSFKNISDYSFLTEMETHLVLDAKTFIGFQCTAYMKIFGMKLLDVNFTTGLEATGKIEDLVLSADAGVRAKSEWKLLNKKKTLFDWYCSLYTYEKPNYAGYKMVIHEACAYGDYVVGQIWRAHNNDTLPYVGELKVQVRKANSSTPIFFTTQTNEEGLFVARDIPLTKGDKVALKISGVQNVSPEMDVSIPFSELKLYHVDYYAGLAEGSVATSKSKWYKMASAQTTSSGGGASVNPAIIVQPKLVNPATVSHNALIQKMKDFRSNLLEYQGPVTFDVKKEHESPIPASRGSSQKTGKPGESVKLKENKGIVRSINGTFTIKNLYFSPGDQVRARVNIEGFVLESEWVDVEGLLVNEIEVQESQVNGNYNSTTVSAAKSFVLITPLHSEVTPTGNVRLLKGMHFSESLPADERNQVAEFPEATNAVVYFDQTVLLQPLEGNPGAAVAEVGPWSKTYSIPMLSTRHFTCNRPFELVSYTYKSTDIGYRYMLNQCKGITEKDLHEMFNQLKAQKLTIKLQKLMPAKVAPKVNPVIPGKF
ncbi:MAG TPA: hypothetical protein PLS41_04685 [Bacteroidales bacterium]|nr:hypothetical protein [Bacteroidales bacterium]HPE86606.1 hypothetical protein [Bacteroidales bacterium]